MSDKIKLKESPLERLNTDCFVEILAFLPNETLFIVIPQVCTWMYEIMKVANRRILRECPCCTTFIDEIRYKTTKRIERLSTLSEEERCKIENNIFKVNIKIEQYEKENKAIFEFGLKKVFELRFSFDKRRFTRTAIFCCHNCIVRCCSCNGWMKKYYMNKLKFLKCRMCSRHVCLCCNQHDKMYRICKDCP